MSVPVQVSGAVGTWESVAGEVATFVLSKAFAPGAPIQIECTLGEASVTVSAKTVGSKKRGEGFEVRAKLIGLTREHRLRLRAHFAPAP